jgi:hypothetical protein
VVASSTRPWRSKRIGNAENICSVRVLRILDPLRTLLVRAFEWKRCTLGPL